MGLIKYTLFDTEMDFWRSKSSPSSYYYGIQELCEEKKFPKDEVAIFCHIAEHEAAYYETRGHIAGPLTLRIDGKRDVDLARLRKPWRVPAFVEQDFIAFKDCKADGILLVEREQIFWDLFCHRSWKELNLILIVGGGVPRLSVRRFMHRICEELKIPAYLLTDNDPWGYFIFSVLKRGLLNPGMSLKFTSLNVLRYLGLCADDMGNYGISESFFQPWKDSWDIRLKALKKYRCFQSSEWSKEFNSFKKLHRGIELVQVYSHLGRKKFIEEFILRRISEKHWLS